MKYENYALNIFHNDVEDKITQTQDLLGDIAKTLDTLRIHTRTMERYQRQMRDRPFQEQKTEWEETIREEILEKLEGYALDTPLDEEKYKHFRVINGERETLMVIHTAPYNDHLTDITVHTESTTWNMRVSDLEPMPLFNHEKGNYSYWAEKLILRDEENENPPYLETVEHIAGKWSEEWIAGYAEEFVDVDKEMIHEAITEAKQFIKYWSPLSEIMDDLTGINIGRKEENIEDWVPFENLNDYHWAMFTPEWIRTCETLAWTARTYIGKKKGNRE